MPETIAKKMMAIRVRLSATQLIDFRDFVNCTIEKIRHINSNPPDKTSDSGVT